MMQYVAVKTGLEPQLEARTIQEWNTLSPSSDLMKGFIGYKGAEYKFHEMEFDGDEGWYDKDKYINDDLKRVIFDVCGANMFTLWDINCITNIYNRLKWLFPDYIEQPLQYCIVEGNTGIITLNYVDEY